MTDPLDQTATDGSIPVVFIGGAGRSGTTLVERIVGNLPGVFGAGEVTFLWDRGLLQNQLCGCSRPLRECPFWTSVIEEAFGSVGACDVAAIESLRRRCTGHWRMTQLSHQWLQGPGLRGRLREYQEIMRRVFAAISHVSGCATIVDSTKYPADALVLSECPGLRFLLVHVVRHPAAVAYAWQKQKRRPEVHWKEEFFPRYHWLKTTLAWNAFNRTLERLGRRSSAYVRVNYEGLVESPRDAMGSICRACGLDESALDQLLEGRTARLGDNHTISGNTIRFQRGAVAIEADEAWRQALPSRQRKWIGRLTSRLARRYGYEDTTPRPPCDGSK